MYHLQFSKTKYTTGHQPFFKLNVLLSITFNSNTLLSSPFNSNILLPIPFDPNISSHPFSILSIPLLAITKLQQNILLLIIFKTIYTTINNFSKSNVQPSTTFQNQMYYYQQLLKTKCTTTNNF